jgi:hypothetical protein
VFLAEDESMAALNRIYERTERGMTALEAPELRAESRWLLGLIKSGTHAETIRDSMRRYTDERIMELLTELEALQLVTSVAAKEEHDLDFTGSLSLGALRAAHNASR